MCFNPPALIRARVEEIMYRVGQHVDDPQTGQTLVVESVDEGYDVLLCKVRQKAAAKPKIPSRTIRKINGAHPTA
jgi:hypothetical protein